MINVFLSYSHNDTARSVELAEELTHALQSEKGVEVWYGQNIQAADNWSEAIEKELEQATTFVLILSPEYLNSNYSAFEMGVAMSRRSQGEAQVIPLLVTDINVDDLPPQLRQNPYRRHKQKCKGGSEVGSRPSSATTPSYDCEY